MKKLDLTVWGQMVSVNSDESEEFIRCVADYLNNKKTEVETDDPTLVSTQIANARAAFLLGAELFVAKQRVEEIEARLVQIETLLRNC
ncbi:MAG: cell division protein ZapA [Deferribacteraceae bacterium]|jgi:cell division protein ZapA (FtsZ GTPase activity inhibitor)|nr:cell division protein ZapA [Deferribacteraceae bacterium]